MRKIIHIDADSFYASVEVRDNPSLRGKPIAVGGSPEQRGVIATASYEARKFGVRSAISSARAHQLCPELTLVAPRFDVYRQVSKQFHEIFAAYTPLIEPLSLDEAYLDVTECTQHKGSATLIADAIRDRIREEIGLTASAGVAPNKFLAKVASDWNKPDGTFTVAPSQIASFVLPLPVAKINGVGKVTTEKLRLMGVVTCGDLQKQAIETLVKRFGKYGIRLAELAKGIDDRPVQTSRTRKSISVERTYPRDIESSSAMRDALVLVLSDLASRFAKIESRYYPTKRFVKVTFRDFTQTTIEQIIRDRAEPWLNTTEFEQLMFAAWQRESLPIRLLGAGLRLEPRSEESDEQLALFETPPS
jgi:DNA polymerase-4